MSRWAQLALAPEVMLAAALLAGLAAAFGRELHEGRRPGWRWWLSMLLLLPAAGLAGNAAADLLPLTARTSALATLLLVLSGYRGLRALEQRWLGLLLAARPGRQSARARREG